MDVTADVMLALRRDLFPPHKYVWATEVTVPGGRKDRRMDATAINCRQAPFLLEGFEVKVSRADWRNDLGGKKSQAARDAVDRFWFVFGSKEIYTPEEVPTECGIIHIHNDRAVAVRQPRAPAAVGTYCRSLLSTILTRTLRETPTSFVSQVARESEAKGYRKGMAAAKRAAPTVTRGGRTKMRYDPARYCFDDGVPLDLP